MQKPKRKKRGKSYPFTSGFGKLDLVKKKREAKTKMGLEREKEKKKKYFGSL